MTAPSQPRVGAVFDVGGALAIYWPDRHPCGATRAEPWLILHDYGGIEWAAELRDGAQLLSYIPGFGMHESICARCGIRGHTSKWCANADSDPLF